jgi:homocysteine S-methyltransferase
MADHVDPLERDGVVVLDGGTGTELEARGARMDHEAWSGLANLDRPDLLRAIHDDYIRAGADVLIANTFSTNRAALAAAGHADRFERANRAAVEIALEAAAAAGRPVAVAGPLSLLGVADGDRESPRVSDEQLIDVYGEQAALLAAAGVDLIVLEMFDARWSAALKPALGTGLPVWAGVWTSLGEDGALVAPTGRPFEDDLPALIDDRIAAVLVMHTVFDAVRPALAAVARHWPGPRGTYPHAGHWERPNWRFEDIAPDVMADHAEAWVRDGARIVGGCCGIGPDHIRAVRDRVAAPRA